MMSVLYEHVDTSIDERFEFVSFNEFRFELVPVTAGLYMGFLVSDILRLLEAYRVESVDVFDEKR